MLGYNTKFAGWATGRLALPGSGGGVTSFPGRRRGGLIGGREGEGLTLAGDGDVFNAADMGAIPGHLGNRAGYFVGIYPPVGGSFREIPRLTIRMGGVGAALVTSGQTLVDAVPVGLVGDDENATIRQRRRTGAEGCKDQKC